MKWNKVSFSKTHWFLPFRAPLKYDYLNHASALPPVACPLVIEVPGRGMVRAERTSFVTSKGNEMEYRLSDGTTLTGRFRWTYP